MVGNRNDGNRRSVFFFEKTNHKLCDFSNLNLKVWKFGNSKFRVWKSDEWLKIRRLERPKLKSLEALKNLKLWLAKLKNWVRYDFEMAIPNVLLFVLIQKLSLSLSLCVNRLSILRSFFFVTTLSFIAAQSSTEASTVRSNLKFIDTNERRKHKRPEISAGIAFVKRTGQFV